MQAMTVDLWPQPCVTDAFPAATVCTCILNETTPIAFLRCKRKGNPLCKVNQLGCYSAAQTQLYKPVRVTHERLRVTQRALASDSCVFYATHASPKGVNCTACGSEIACASNLRVRVTLRVRVALRVRVKLRVRVILLILITIVI